MFEIGSYMVYGTNGVCRVTDICVSPFDKHDSRRYYVLKPVSGPSEAVIYTPVDNDRVPMRALLSREETEALLGRLPSIPKLLVEVEKMRREIYRAVMNAADPDSYIALIKTVKERRSEFAGTTRRLPDFESEYDSTARRHLFTELSVVLGIPMEKIEEHIRKKADVAAV